MNSKNIHSKRVVANNIFTGIVVILLVVAVVLVIALNIKDHGKGSYSKGTWNVVSDSDMFGENGNLVSVYPQYPDTDDTTTVSGTVTLKGIFEGADGTVAAIIDFPKKGTVSLKTWENVGNVTLMGIEDGVVTLSIDGNEEYLSMDEPTIEVN